MDMFLLSTQYFISSSSETENHVIYVYDGTGKGDFLHKFEKLHMKPIVLMKV